jgi:adenylyltransferase/sulfurtransferase
MSETLSRYRRQTRLTELGEEGQERLSRGRVLVIGCGGLGAAVTELVVRAGVGHVHIADGDIVEVVNLHRQLMYDEEDAAARRPKVEAAVRKLALINSAVKLYPHPVRVVASNILSLVAEVDVVVDATDNIESRYLINDACLEAGKPWVYGGAVGTTGMTMNIVPGLACLQCAFAEPPGPGSLPTCDTIGVLNTLPAMVATIQATETLKLLVGSRAKSDALVTIDPWRGAFSRVKVKRDPQCPACGKNQRRFLRPPP